jgi:RNA polymerase sigma-70 factor (ECF subfamily)
MVRAEFVADDKLIDKLRKGDVDAFDMVYHRYAGKLFAFALKYLKSREEAEELVQSVFLKVWENQATLKKETSFKSYLFTIAYNEICNLFRKRKYLQNFIESAISEKPETSTEMESQIEFRFVLEQVDQIIVQLPEKQRVVFLKSRQEGKSSKEIADELGLSKGTVDNYISESLKFIRASLNDKHIALTLFIYLFFV